MKKIIISLISVLTLSSNFAFAEQTTDSLLLELQKGWAIANYQLKNDDQSEAFESLIAKADSSLNQHAGDAKLLIWAGIIKSTYAGVKGGLGALGLAKAARKHLEQALTIDEVALQGSAFTSLGTLYHSVPGWPIGFGSDKKAKKLLKRAIEINPDGIDSNYFYADFLSNNGEYRQAIKYFELASNAKPRPGREIADQGRQHEIQSALAKIKEKL